MKCGAIDACQPQTSPKRSWMAAHRTRVLAGLFVLFALRVLYLLVCPLELIPDEAYYWDWSRQLDWSYYSKPPLIAWLIALTTSVLGESEFSIRLPAAVAGTLGLWMVYELGRRLYGHQAGVWALVVVAVSPGMTALCLLMTVDAPFLLTWAVAVYCLWRMFESSRGDVRWLVPAIVATGVGLLAKQSALGLFPLAILFLASGESDRRLLRSPVLWSWVLGSLAFLLPVVWWNHGHSWITIAHTSEHLDLESSSLIRHLTLYFEFAASQFGILSPLVASLVTIAMVGLIVVAFQQRRERFLVCFGSLPLFAITLMSFFQRVQPNWPVALHLTTLVGLAAWRCELLSFSNRWDYWRRWLPASICFGAAMSILVALIPVVIPSTPLSGTTFDLTGRLRGWRELSDQVSAKLSTVPSPHDVLVVAATSRGPVSELAYYLPGRPRVYRWNVGEVVDSQHDVWGGPTEARGRDALIVTDGTDPIPPKLADAFSFVEDLGPVSVEIGPGKSRNFRVWLGTSLHAWPDRSVSNSLVSLSSSPNHP